MWLLEAVLLLLPVSLGYKSGCLEWRLEAHSTSDVCCKVCHPGNRLVMECGPDPTALCEPCANGTYVTTSKAMMCRRCSECSAPQSVKRPCSAETDTQCECVQGFLCGDPTCSFCIKECGKGEEPSNTRNCQPCPPGTFNDQHHSPCVRWSESCPRADQRITAPGTAVSDIICSTETTTLRNHTPSHDSLELSLVPGVVCVCLTASVILPLLMVTVWKRGEKLKGPPGLEEAPAVVLDQDHCSFCFPQEESSGSSATSLVSDGDDKPFELVV
ncbi:tumor necrosis factor receptor superfamily member 9b [Brachyhypopomus gauderio]|uniref:tumor necrosis factor receptor superfamily member 9b n=1 Tax=Brachyhypopomus gauderio TaxID=698409 RepID=UPI004041FEFF